jgi:hypothetical protein
MKIKKQNKKTIDENAIMESQQKINDWKIFGKSKFLEN